MYEITRSKTLQSQMMRAIKRIEFINREMDISLALESWKPEIFRDGRVRKIHISWRLLEESEVEIKRWQDQNKRIVMDVFSHDELLITSAYTKLPRRIRQEVPPRIMMIVRDKINGQL